MTATPAPTPDTPTVRDPNADGLTELAASRNRVHALNRELLEVSSRTDHNGRVTPRKENAR